MLRMQGQVYVLTNIPPLNKGEVMSAQSLTVEAFSSSCSGSQLCVTLGTVQAKQSSPPEPHPALRPKGSTASSVLWELEPQLLHFSASLNTALTPPVLNPQQTLNLPNPVTSSHTNKTILRIFPAVFFSCIKWLLVHVRHYLRAPKLCDRK